MYILARYFEWQAEEKCAHWTVLYLISTFTLVHIGQQDGGGHSYLRVVNGSVGRTCDAAERYLRAHRFRSVADGFNLLPESVCAEC